MFSRGHFLLPGVFPGLPFRIRPAFGFDLRLHRLQTSPQLLLSPFTLFFGLRQATQQRCRRLFLFRHLCAQDFQFFLQTATLLTLTGRLACQKLHFFPEFRHLPGLFRQLLFQRIPLRFRLPQLLTHAYRHIFGAGPRLFPLGHLFLETFALLPQTAQFCVHLRLTLLLAFPFAPQGGNFLLHDDQSFFHFLLPLHRLIQLRLHGIQF